MNDRIIEIENYWARVVRDTAEFQQIADAENPEFNTVLKCLYNILKDGFINDLTENGAMRWEKILELPVSSTATLEERKVQILTYLSIRRPYTIRVLRAMLSAIMGEGNYTLNINNDTSTLTIALASTVEHMREKIDELCARVIPQNLVIDVDELPMEYTKVEYLESTGAQRIVVNRALSVADDCTFVYKAQSTGGSGWVHAFGARVAANSKEFGVTYNLGGTSAQVALGGAPVGIPCEFSAVHEIKASAATGAVECGGETRSITPRQISISSIGVFQRTGVGSYFTGRIFKVGIFNAGQQFVQLIPAIDPTGAPCMFDTVTRTAFYNSGTGDFLYPTDAAPAVSADLDEKFYAKRTEHGIRRLYHVPEGCNMSKDEYAAKNGFKAILEPPMPLEGYWVPQWKETETQLICEWVETEPPTEEGIENE